MDIYTHKTEIHPPDLNLVPQKSNSTMHNFKMPQVSLLAVRFYILKLQTPAFHKLNMPKVSYFVLAVFILIS